MAVDNKTRTDVMEIEGKGEINMSILNKMDDILNKFINDKETVFIEPDPENEKQDYIVKKGHFNMTNGSYVIQLKVEEYSEVAINNVRGLSGIGNFTIDIHSKKSNTDMSYGLLKTEPLTFIPGKVQHRFTFKNTSTYFVDDTDCGTKSLDECLKAFDALDMEYFHKTVTAFVEFSEKLREDYYAKIEAEKEAAKEAKRQAKRDAIAARKAEEKRQAEERQNKLNSELDDF